MKVLIYPHSMELGGSQLNALQLAEGVRDLGHDVIVASETGPLLDKVREAGLRHIGIPRHRARPSPRVGQMLRSIVKDGAIDVVHGHEWPPIVEAFLSVGLSTRAAVVGTVMSMSVPSFLPRAIPLTVGTEMILRAAVVAGHREVTLLEPPVDTISDHPLVDGTSFRVAQGIGPDQVVIAMVCRLVPNLKLEGLLSACDAVGEMALEGRPVRLLIIGDGPARPTVEERAARTNYLVGRNAVVLVGEMSDPRPGYAAADIIIGQGGSALRGMAFGKPLVVVGEDGFSELLTPESAPTFLRQGWYGLGNGSRGAGADALRSALETALASASLRYELGKFGRRLVEHRFSLVHAAKTIEQTYLHAVRTKMSTGRRLTDAGRCVVSLASYKVQRKYQRWMGLASAEDDNDRARISAVLSATHPATKAIGPRSDRSVPNPAAGISRQPDS
ncbi:glycosyltransferase involved in cell wall biosynthesis [Bradyrhizobium sp. USDA 3686]|uniref:glycosyltransferase family 4 protein n=1 Tax=Bradyrhizobium TaxID=374 RepID=UPI00195F1AE4|nr:MULTISPECIES: glycosyltransferase family 4 protein [Bradyrhizobium]MBM7481779.1 glycosyltransferase involved in cell wall biosynthesis [Bradyrhizobium canariense]MCK1676451.1 glycosyltransferase family 4 protein [Bradyrhizobium sp. 150]UFW70018.1 glycosyltransferase family 4 protein [Bradyrhizobium canariense]